MRKYLLDTNCFDYIFNNGISIDKLKSTGIFYTSIVQFSELKNIKDKVKRESLLKIYNQLEQIKLHLQSGIWNDDLYWDDDQIWRDDQTADFSNLQKGNHKHSKDALIGELTANSNIILVTSDKKFQNKCITAKINFIEVQDIFKD